MKSLRRVVMWAACLALAWPAAVCPCHAAALLAPAPAPVKKKSCCDTPAPRPAESPGHGTCCDDHTPSDLVRAEPTDPPPPNEIGPPLPPTREVSPPVTVVSPTTHVRPPPVPIYLSRCALVL